MLRCGSWAVVLALLVSACARDSVPPATFDLQRFGFSGPVKRIEVVHYDYWLSEHPSLALVESPEEWQPPESRHWAEDLPRVNVEVLDYDREGRLISGRAWSEEGVGPPTIRTTTWTHAADGSVKMRAHWEDVPGKRSGHGASIHYPSPQHQVIVGWNKWKRVRHDSWFDEQGRVVRTRYAHWFEKTVSAQTEYRRSDDAAGELLSVTRYPASREDVIIRSRDFDKDVHGNPARIWTLTEYVREAGAEVGPHDHGVMTTYKIEYYDEAG